MSAADCPTAAVEGRQSAPHRTAEICMANKLRGFIARPFFMSAVGVVSNRVSIRCAVRVVQHRKPAITTLHVGLRGKDGKADGLASLGLALKCDGCRGQGGPLHHVDMRISGLRSQLWEEIKH